MSIRNKNTASATASAAAAHQQSSKETFKKKDPKKFFEATLKLGSKAMQKQTTTTASGQALWSMPSTLR